jgi:hypothetical protein
VAGAPGGDGRGSVAVVTKRSHAATPTRRSRRGGRVRRQVHSLFATGGPGFRDLAVTQVCSTSADTLVAIALAGTLFFSVPTAEARGNVALYLLLTVAPFAVIGPTLGRILDRAPLAIRTVLVVAAIGRAALSLSLVTRADSWWLYPAAFGILVLSRVHAIARNSLLPLALDEPRALVAANARLAWIGVLVGGLTAGVGLAAAWVAGPDGPLVLATLAAVLAGVLGRRLPEPQAPLARPAHRSPRARLHLPRAVRLAQLATAGVRAAVGFLLLLLAFQLRADDAGLLDIGALLAASGLGFALASRLVPFLERRIPEEPMVVAALSLTAVAAFVAAQWYGLAAAAVLAATVGIAWGVAKLAFDGLLQASVPAGRRGAAFTRSETVFSIAFVLGALPPTAVPIPLSIGLLTVGFAALTAQLVYVATLLRPLPTTDPRAAADGTAPEP